MGAFFVPLVASSALDLHHDLNLLFFSVPMLATANPIGSVLDHSAMHVAAVVHEYEGKVRLPPATTADGGEGR